MSEIIGVGMGSRNGAQDTMAGPLPVFRAANTPPAQIHVAKLCGLTPWNMDGGARLGLPGVLPPSISVLLLTSGLANAVSSPIPLARTLFCEPLRAPVRGVFCFGGAMVFLIDGFNLYHSLRDAEGELGHGCRWLDLRRLCDSVRRSTTSERAPADVEYFSALATHRQNARPDSVDRHRVYISVLEATGVSISLGQFKKKEARCRWCGRINVTHEEKETDVAIGGRLVECAATGIDFVMLMSGDTDLLPAIRTARRVRSTIRIGIAFPYWRANAALKQETDFSVRMTPRLYASCQFGNSVSLGAGQLAVRPDGW